MFAIQTRRWEVMMFLTLVALLVVAALARGGHAVHSLPVSGGSGPLRTWIEPGNNRLEVWERLQRDADLFVLGKELTVEEHGLFTKALVRAVAGEDPTLGGSEAESLLLALRAEILRHLGEDARPLLARLDDRALLRALAEARVGEPKWLNEKSIRIEVGFAAYRHWKALFTQTSRELREERLAMPPTYQPYIRVWLGPR